MKKMLMAATVALCFAGNAFAEDIADPDAVKSTIGGVATTDIAATLVGAGIAGALISNNRGTAKTRPDGTIVEPTCNGADPLVDGVCVGTTSTVTVTGTGTMTSTTTVPVTFTYTPSV
ncbi:MAG: opacity protein-like surface antigen [Paraglaciecola sp.]|jgi:opacity protein-like surface antigen